MPDSAAVDAKSGADGHQETRCRPAPRPPLVHSDPPSSPSPHHPQPVDTLEREPVSIPVPEPEAPKRARARSPARHQPPSTKNHPHIPARATSAPHEQHHPSSTRSLDSLPAPRPADDSIQQTQRSSSWAEVTREVSTATRSHRTTEQTWRPCIPAATQRGRWTRDISSRARGSRGRIRFARYRR